jgi:hypothetical protein
MMMMRGNRSAAAAVATIEDCGSPLHLQPVVAA